jgi:hypothetical protein
MLLIFNFLNPCFSSGISHEKLPLLEEPISKKLLRFPHISSDPLFTLSAAYNSEPLGPKEVENILKRFASKGPYSTLGRAATTFTYELERFTSRRTPGEATLKLAASLFHSQFENIVLSQASAASRPADANLRLANMVLGNDVTSSLKLWQPKEIDDLRSAGIDCIIFTTEPRRELIARILDLRIINIRLSKEIERLTAELTVKKKIKEAVEKESNKRKETGLVDYEKIEASLSKEVRKLISGKPALKRRAPKGADLSTETVSLRDPSHPEERDSLVDDYVEMPRARVSKRVTLFNFDDNTLKDALQESLREAERLEGNLDNALRSSVVSASASAASSLYVVQSGVSSREENSSEKRASAIYAHYVFAEKYNAFSGRDAALKEELSSLINTFQGLDHRGATTSLLTQYNKLLLKNRDLDGYLSKRKLSPFGVRLKKHKKEATVDFREARVVTYFQNLNTYCIEHLSLKGEVLNLALLNSLKSKQWTKDFSGAVKEVLIPPNMESLRSLELEFGMLENSALAKSLSLSTAATGLRALSLIGDVTAENLDSLSKMQPSLLGFLEKLEIYGIHPMCSATEFINSLVRLVIYTRQLKTIELAFGNKNISRKSGDLEVLAAAFQSYVPQLEFITISADEISEDLIAEFQQRIQTSKELGKAAVTVKTRNQIMDQKPSVDEIWEDLTALASLVSVSSTASTSSSADLGAVVQPLSSAAAAAEPLP